MSDEVEIEVRKEIIEAITEANIPLNGVAIHAKCEASNEMLFTMRQLNVMVNLGQLSRLEGGTYSLPDHSPVTETVEEEGQDDNATLDLTSETESNDTEEPPEPSEDGTGNSPEHATTVDTNSSSALAQDKKETMPEKALKLFDVPHSAISLAEAMSITKERASVLLPEMKNKNMIVFSHKDGIRKAWKRNPDYDPSRVVTQPKKKSSTKKAAKKKKNAQEKRDVATQFVGGQADVTDHLRDNIMRNKTALESYINLVADPDILLALRASVQSAEDAFKAHRVKTEFPDG
ncbi:MAG: hypothetical protein GKR93_12090 [Gammaproteobacteria bacterium]|nr:hypothetical protein [Gammaproteobacteria bacterium]